MRVESVSNTPTILPNLLKVQPLSKSMAAPVQPAQAIYARFKHIRSVPSSENGVSLFKLRILDNTLDRLLKEGEGMPSNLSGKAVDAQTIDPLIEGLQKTLRNKMLHLPSPFGGQFSAQGSIINLVA